MDVSIVTTLYYSEPYLEEFHERITAAATRITSNYELVLVNDGSPDRSLEIARTLCEKDFHVRVIDLSRNFGHHAAVMTGLEHTKGDLVFLVDCDLEEEPELLNAFYNAFQDSDADVVYGLQRRRKGGFLERSTGAIFYWLTNLLASHPIPVNDTLARIMSRRYVDALVDHREREIFLGGVFALAGFLQQPLFIDKLSKKKSTYTFSRKVSLFIRAITSLSNKPLFLIFYLGLLVCLGAGVGAGWLIVRSLVFGAPLPALLLSIWLIGGLLLLSLGVIGLYLASVFTESKQRPYTVIREIYARGPAPKNDDRSPPAVPLDVDGSKRRRRR